MKAAQQTDRLYGVCDKIFLELRDAPGHADPRELLRIP